MAQDLLLLNPIKEKHMLKHLLVWTIVLVTFCSLGQKEQTKLEIYQGRKVYVHTVESGNTLYGIHRTYNVPVEDIVEMNPGIDKGVKEGQIVRIPVPIISETINHKVVSGETLYAIGRKYSVSPDDIMAWNPGADKGIKEGQTIVIKKFKYATGGEAPATAAKPSTGSSTPTTSVKVAFDDTVVQHVVQEKETLFSISKRYMVPQEQIVSFNNKKNTNIKPGEVLRIPLKKERVADVKVREVPTKSDQPRLDTTLLFKKKEVYNIAILMPFFLDKGQGYSEAVSNMSAEYLMGAQMALDSLEKLGLFAKVHVFDSKNSADEIRAILAKPEFKSMDLVFGPLYKQHAQVIADWCKANKVRYVIPVNVDTKILQENPFVYTTIGSDITLMKGLARFVHKGFKDEKVVLVKPTSKADSLLYQAFRTEYIKLAGNGGKLIETTPSEIATFMARSPKIAVVYPTTEARAAGSFIKEMEKAYPKMGESNVYLFASDAWLDFDGVSQTSRTKFQLTVPCTIDLNYSTDMMKRYHRKYRSTYKSDFSKMAVQGFDVTFNYCAELLLNRKVGSLLMNNFKSVQVGQGHGYENQNVELIQVKEFELRNVTNGIR